jgi:hypothetical protein
MKLRSLPYESAEMFPVFRLALCMESSSQGAAVLDRRFSRIADKWSSAQVVCHDRLRRRRGTERRAALPRGAQTPRATADLGAAGAFTCYIPQAPAPG